MTLPPLAPLVEIPDAALARWKAGFIKAGFTGEILGLAEKVAPALFDPLRLPVVLWFLERRGDPAAHLARLFVYDDAVERAHLQPVLEERTLVEMEEAGILAADNERPERLRARFRLVPIEGLWILSDPLTTEPSCVMGPGITTQHLTCALPEKVDGRVCDLGCGAGTLALLAALRGAEAAVGTDINPRAVELARFNARLNGVKAEFLCGNLTEPVHGTRFSLFLSQPPYIVRPAAMAPVTFLHGGAAGDEIVLRLAAEIPACLEDGGRALLVIQVPSQAGRPLHQRLREALGGAPVDLFVFTAAGSPPDLQAIGYAMLEDPKLGPRYAETARQYREHFAVLGTEQFDHSFIVIRRPKAGGRAIREAATPGTAAAGGPPLFADGARGKATVELRVRTLPRHRREVLEDLLAGFDLASLDDATLGRQAVCGSPRAAWTEERPRPGAEGDPVFKVRFPPDAILFDQEITEAAYVLNSVLDQSETVDEAVARYAELCGAPSEEVRAPVLNFVREGLARGTLAPAALTGSTAGERKDFA
jgi:SAM-dependent methyltransferase